MLQNRVDPLGNIIATSARGAWMGNRGLLHDRGKTILRPFKLKAWITCLLEFKGRRRPVMEAGQYTELFFLDEATSFSAGHRPCFECRREDAVRFKGFWVAGNPSYGFTMKTPIGEIDDIIHRERIAGNGEKVIFSSEIGEVPDGCFVVWEGKVCLVWGGRLFEWGPFGYGQEMEGRGAVTVLTPGSIVNAFRAGYVPQVGKKRDGARLLSTGRDI